MEKGVCEILALDDMYKLDNKPVLNGLFAVGKGEFQGDLETQRLCRSLAGDVRSRRLKG